MTLVIVVFLMTSTSASPKAASPGGPGLFDGALGASGVLRPRSESLAAGKEGIWAVKRTMMVDGSSYVCCIGDIFCVSGTCESSLTLTN